MMLDFPANPTDGDTIVFGGLTFVWTADPGVWRIVTGTAGGGASVTVSDTPPADPTDGDLWLNTGDDYGLYAYYDDGDSQQWVQTNGSMGGSVQRQEFNDLKAAFLGTARILNTETVVDSRDVTTTNSSTFVGAQAANYDPKHPNSIIEVEVAVMYQTTRTSGGDDTGIDWELRYFDGANYVLSAITAENVQKPRVANTGGTGTQQFHQAATFRLTMTPDMRYEPTTPVGNYGRVTPRVYAKNTFSTSELQSKRPAVFRFTEYLPPEQNVAIPDAGLRVQEYHDPNTGAGAQSWRIVGNTLEVWGTTQLSAGGDASISFAKTFARQPQVVATGVTGIESSSRTWDVKVRPSTATGFTMDGREINNGTVSVWANGSVMWRAVGEWDGVS